MAELTEIQQIPNLIEKCYTQEEMRKTLIEKFYELDEIHLDEIETTQSDIISAANVMDSIYRTLFIDEEAGKENET